MGYEGDTEVIIILSETSWEKAYQFVETYMTCIINERFLKTNSKLNFNKPKFISL